MGTRSVSWSYLSSFRELKVIARRGPLLKPYIDQIQAHIYEHVRWISYTVMAGPGTDGQLAIIPYVGPRTALCALIETLPGFLTAVIDNAATF